MLNVNNYIIEPFFADLEIGLPIMHSAYRLSLLLNQSCITRNYLYSQ